MTVKFTVGGAPFGKQRPRHNRYTNTTYTPKETINHEALVAMIYRMQYGQTKFEPRVPLKITVRAYMSIPKGATKAKRKLMLEGTIRPTVKPDWDNIGKLVADALNGVAYDDDKCICAAIVEKFYSDAPRTEIEVTECVVNPGNT